MVRSRILNLVVKLSYVVFGAAVFSLWLTALFHISSLCKGNSDGAFLVIAGNSVLKGNFLLRGYHLSLLDPFFPFDIYLNALFIKIFGFRPALSHIVPVFIFLILIAVSLLYVIEANKGRALLFGIVVLVLAFLMSDLAANRASARYLIPAVVYGFILSSRNIPAIASKYYSSISFKLICAVIIIAYTVSFEYAAFTPIPVSPYRTLGNWFLKHNFTYGYGSYWDSGIVTLMTRGKIKVRQINASNYGKLVPYNWLSKNSWYKEKGVFVIYSKYKMYGGVDKSSIIKTFGKPSKIYTEYFQGVFNKVYGSYGTAAKNIMPPFIIKIYVYNKGIIIDGKNNMNVKYRKHRAGG